MLAHRTPRVRPFTGNSSVPSTRCPSRRPRPALTPMSPQHSQTHTSPRPLPTPPRSFEPNSPEDLEKDSPQRLQPTLIKAPAGPLSKVNTAYLSVTALMTLLMVFKNPYIFAFLVIATVIPQNSNVTSLNTLVVWFYETGLFMNFAEAVTCVRLMTWLSIAYCLLSFALFT